MKPSGPAYFFFWEFVDYEFNLLNSYRTIQSIYFILVSCNNLSFLRNWFIWSESPSFYVQSSSQYSLIILSWCLQGLWWYLISFLILVIGVFSLFFLCQSCSRFVNMIHLFKEKDFCFTDFFLSSSCFQSRWFLFLSLYLLPSAYSGFILMFFWLLQMIY